MVALYIGKGQRATDEIAYLINDNNYEHRLKHIVSPHFGMACKTGV